MLFPDSSGFRSIDFTTCFVLQTLPAGQAKQDLVESNPNLSELDF